MPPCVVLKANVCLMERRVAGKNPFSRKALGRIEEMLKIAEYLLWISGNNP